MSAKQEQNESTPSNRNAHTVFCSEAEREQLAILAELGHVDLQAARAASTENQIKPCADHITNEFRALNLV